MLCKIDGCCTLQRFENVEMPAEQMGTAEAVEKMTGEKVLMEQA